MILRLAVFLPGAVSTSYTKRRDLHGPYRNVAVAGMSSRLVVNARCPMLGRMTGWPDAEETWEFPFRRRSQPAMFRAFKRQLNLERKYTDQLFNGVRLAVNTEIGCVERRIMAKLEEIDTSLGLIAREIARHADDPPSAEVGR
jgi:hypothetical protein